MGIIWNEGGELEGAVRNGIRAFVKRFGMRPGLVEVHRSRLEGERVIDGVPVKPVKNLLAHDVFVKEAV